MKRVMDNDFKEEHQVTIGVEFGSFGLKINNQVVKLQIWDTVSTIDIRLFSTLTKYYFINLCRLDKNHLDQLPVYFTEVLIAYS